MIKTGIFFFNKDLRLDDNPALLAAAEQVDQLICIYILNQPSRLIEHQIGFSISENRQQFLYESLNDLNNSLQKLGQHLLVFTDNQKLDIADIVENHQISHFFRSGDQHYSDSILWNWLQKKFPKIDFQEVSNNRLYSFSNLPFTVEDLPQSFSKFRRKIESITPDNPVSAPRALPPAVIDPIPWPKELNVKISGNSLFSGGETQGANFVQNYFLHDYASSYKETRNGLDGMSYSTKFSPWLAHGCVSVRRILSELRFYERDREANDSTYWIFFELLWREYFQWYADKFGVKLFNFSGIKNSKPKTSFYPQRFEKWVTGDTPYPIVNACMKQLKATGYMSNRGRQLVASCFVNELSLDWRYGAAYMEQQLIDFDIAANWGNWQYLAGVGADPRGLRSFDLQKQTHIYDPQQHFIKKWGGTKSSNLDSTDMVDWPIIQPTGTDH